MEFGNVYEVFQIGDIVKVKDIASIYCGEIGVIVRIEETGCYTEPIYIIRLDRADLQAFDNPNKRLEIRINAKSLVKTGHIDSDEETITMGLRSGKTYLTQIGSFKNKDNGFDSIIYDLKKKRKFAEGGNTMKKLDVKKIIFSGPKTIVLWSDGTKTIVSMSKDEAKFDPEAAFCAAYTKKMFGSNSKIKRVIKEKSNIKKWKELNEVPEDQLYKLGLKALAECEDIDMEAIERASKEAEKLTPEILKNMYETLTGHPYEREKDNGEN